MQTDPSPPFYTMHVQTQHSLLTQIFFINDQHSPSNDTPTTHHSHRSRLTHHIHTHHHHLTNQPHPRVHWPQNRTSPTTTLTRQPYTRRTTAPNFTPRQHHAHDPFPPPSSPSPSEPPTHMSPTIATTMIHPTPLPNHHCNTTFPNLTLPHHHFPF